MPSSPTAHFTIIVTLVAALMTSARAEAEITLHPDTRREVSAFAKPDGDNQSTDGTGSFNASAFISNELGTASAFQTSTLDVNGASLLIQGSGSASANGFYWVAGESRISVEFFTTAGSEFDLVLDLSGSDSYLITSWGLRLGSGSHHVKDTLSPGQHRIIVGASPICFIERCSDSGTFNIDCSVTECSPSPFAPGNGACDPQFKVVGVEVNQVIQDWHNSIPLVAGKPSWVRAHVEPVDPANFPPHVTAQLRIKHVNSGQEVVIRPSNPGGNGIPLAHAALTQNAATARLYMTDTLNFRLPDQTVVETGPVELTLEPVSGAATFTCHAVGLDGNCRRTIQFEERVGPRLRLIGYQYTLQGTHSAIPRSNLMELYGRLLTMMPYSRVQALDVKTDKLIREPVQHGGTILKYVARERQFAIFSWKSLGILREGPSISCYTGGAPFCAGLAVCGGTDGWAVFDPATVLTDATTAHEFSHLVGLHDGAWTTNAGGCSVSGCGGCAGGCRIGCSQETVCCSGACSVITYDTDPLLPDHILLGSITNGANSEMWGLDTWRVGPIADPYSPYDAFPVMSYCFTAFPMRWMAAPEYMFLYNRATTLNDLDNPARGAPGEYIIVSGEIDPELETAIVDPIIAASFPNGALIPDAGPYLLQQLDGDSHIIHEIAFDAPLAAHAHGGGRAFVVAAPAIAGTVTVRILAAAGKSPDARILANVSASQNPPTVAIVSPLGDSRFGRDNIHLEWAAGDLDNDPLTFTVQFTTDAVEWDTLSDAETGRSLDIALDSLPGSSQAQLRVIASDGFHSAVAITPSFTVPDAVPILKISSLIDGAAFYGEQPVHLSATAYDVENGLLDPQSVEWTSNLNGRLGSGNITVLARDLIEGVHTITATVFDSTRESSSKSVVIRTYSTIPAPPECDGDIVSSGAVDIDDLLVVIGHWGEVGIPGSIQGDIAPSGGNGVIDIDDLLEIIGHWGGCPKR